MTGESVSLGLGAPSVDDIAPWAQPQPAPDAAAVLAAADVDAMYRRSWADGVMLQPDFRTVRRAWWQPGSGGGGGGLAFGVIGAPGGAPGAGLLRHPATVDGMIQTYADTAVAGLRASNPGVPKAKMVRLLHPCRQSCTCSISASNSFS